jgi:hypothetical protein
MNTYLQEYCELHEWLSRNQQDCYETCTPKLVKFKPEYAEKSKRLKELCESLTDEDKKYIMDRFNMTTFGNIYHPKKNIWFSWFSKDSYYSINNFPKEKYTFLGRFPKAENGMISGYIDYYNPDWKYRWIKALPIDNDYMYFGEE